MNIFLLHLLSEVWIFLWENNCLVKTLCRKLQNQDPPNQHLAKENENVSWTAKKLCHHTYHAIHSINIRTESKLFCLLCWTGWNWFMNRLGIAHNMMHCTLDLCPDQTSLGRNIVYQFKVKESYCLIYILSCNSRFLSGLSVCSDFWWSVILTRTNYMGSYWHWKIFAHFDSYLCTSI